MTLPQSESKLKLFISLYLVWCGVVLCVLCGVVMWYGVVWSCVAWCGVVWYNAIWCNIVWDG